MSIFGFAATFNNAEYQRNINSKINKVFRKEDKISVTEFKEKSIWKNLTKNAPQNIIKNLESIFKLDEDATTVSRDEFEVLLRIADCDSDMNLDNKYEINGNLVQEKSLQTKIEDVYAMSLEKNSSGNITQSDFELSSFKKSDNPGIYGTFVVNINSKEIQIVIDKSITNNGNFMSQFGRLDTQMLYNIIIGIFENFDARSMNDLTKKITAIEFKDLNAISNDIEKYYGSGASAGGYYNSEEQNKIVLSLERVIGLEDNGEMIYTAMPIFPEKISQTLKHEMTHSLDYVEFDDEILELSSQIEGKLNNLKNILKEINITEVQMYLLTNPKEYLAEYNSSSYNKGAESSYNQLINELQERLQTEDDVLKQKIDSALNLIEEINTECNSILYSSRY